MSYIDDAVSGVAGQSSGNQGLFGLSGKDWAGIGIGGAGALLPLLFGNSDTGLNNAIGSLKDQASQAGAMAKTFGQQGQDLFGPVQQYLKAVTGGDRQALLQATMPERTRVIDQYATAKRSAAEFGTRSGGTASTGMELGAHEASDLANVGATARQAGFQQAGDLGTKLAGMGLTAMDLQRGDLTTVLQALQKQGEDKAGAWSGFGKALGTIAGFFL